MPEIKVTIRELYDRVWLQPTSIVAKECGISARGLGKVCERHRIHVPARGCWRVASRQDRDRAPAIPRRREP
jgi:hypothetical protein